MNNVVAASMYLLFFAVAAKNIYDFGKMRGFDRAHAGLEAKHEEVYAILDRLKRLEAAKNDDNGNQG